MFPPAQRKTWNEARSFNAGVLPESLHSISKARPVIVSPGLGEVTRTSARVNEARTAVRRETLRKIMAAVSVKGNGRGVAGDAKARRIARTRASVWKRSAN